MRESTPNKNYEDLTRLPISSLESKWKEKAEDWNKKAENFAHIRESIKIKQVEKQIEKQSL